MVTKFNKSTTYLLPLFAEYIPFNHIELLSTSYLSRADYQILDHFHIQYKFNGKHTTGSYLEFEKELKSHALFVDSVDLDKGTHVLFTFKTPPELVSAMLHFKEGEYSKLHEHFKKSILSFWDFKFSSKALLKLHGVLYKTEALRSAMSKSLECEIDEDAELTDKWNKKLEYINV